MKGITNLKSDASVKLNGIENFPSSYQTYLKELSNKYPDWKFTALYTNLDWNYVINQENIFGKNLVPKNYSDNWKNTTPGQFNVEIDAGWVDSSKHAVEYCMDPRNFLNDIDVFQFQDVNSYPTGAVTLDGIRNETSGTFLQGFENDINNACISQNVNPYFVLARLFQEQGRKGSTIGTGMQGPDGKTYYNPYNIGAVTGNEYETALATAMQNGWDTMQKALEAGIVILKENWLENYQNTLYQNKFDIDTRNGSTLYTHQYM